MPGHAAIYSEVNGIADIYIPGHAAWFRSWWDSWYIYIPGHAAIYSEVNGIADIYTYIYLDMPQYIPKLMG